MKNNILYILLISVSCSIHFGAFGQQNFQLSQYMNGMNLINPAISGIEDYTKVNLGYRKQWAGWTGNGTTPASMYIVGNTRVAPKPYSSTSMPLRTAHDDASTISSEKGNSNGIHGVGGYIYSDNYVYFKRVSLGTSYAYHLKLNDEFNLSAGIALGLTNNAIDISQLSLYDEVNDNSYLSLLNSNNSKIAGDMNLGLLLYSKEFFLGYSAFQVFGGRQFSKVSGLDARYFLQHNIIAGYNIKMNDDVVLLPSVLIKTLTNVPTTIDFSLKATIKNKYFGGLSYRTEDAIIFFLGTQISENIAFSYSYDYNLSDIRNYSTGGHEINLSVLLSRKNGELKQNYFW